MAFHSGITPTMSVVKLTNLEPRIAPAVSRRLDYGPMPPGGWPSTTDVAPVPRFDPNYFPTRPSGRPAPIPTSGFKTSSSARPIPPPPMLSSVNGSAAPISRRNGVSHGQFPRNVEVEMDQAPVSRVKAAPEAFLISRQAPNSVSMPNSPKISRPSNAHVPFSPSMLNFMSSEPSKLTGFIQSPPGNRAIEPQIDIEEGEEDEDELLERARPCWIFSKDYIRHQTPSRKHGVSAEKELHMRQEATGFIERMGHTLKLRQLTINTAIAYMHRFYMHHPFVPYLHWKPVAIASTFLACKTEEDLHLAHRIVKAAYQIMYDSPASLEDERYQRLLKELYEFESLLIGTLGFDFAVEHPHTYIVSIPNLLRNSMKFSSTSLAGVFTKDFQKTCYHVATESLRFTTLSLELNPKTLACVCIHAAAKTAHKRIPWEWFSFIEPSLTYEFIEKYANELIVTCKNAPAYMRNAIANKTIVKPESSPIGATSPSSPESPDSGKGASDPSGSGEAETQERQEAELGFEFEH